MRAITCDTPRAQNSKGSETNENHPFWIFWISVPEKQPEIEDFESWPLTGHDLWPVGPTMAPGGIDHCGGALRHAEPEELDARRVRGYAPSAADGLLACGTHSQRSCWVCGRAWWCWGIQNPKEPVGAKTAKSSPHLEDVEDLSIYIDWSSRGDRMMKIMVDSMIDSMLSFFWAFHSWWNCTPVFNRLVTPKRFLLEEAIWGVTGSEGITYFFQVTTRCGWKNDPKILILSWFVTIPMPI